MIVRGIALEKRSSTRPKTTASSTRPKTTTKPSGTSISQKTWPAESTTPSAKPSVTATSDPQLAKSAPTEPPMSYDSTDLFDHIEKCDTCKEYSKFLDAVKHYVKEKGVAVRTIGAFDVPLIVAAVQGDDEPLLTFCISNKFPVDTVMVDRGITAASLACHQSKHNFVKALLQSGANVNQTHDNTLLCIAANKADMALLELLLGAGAQVDLPGHDGKTPLAIAVLSQKDMSFVECLLKHKASPNAIDEDGMTPFLYAVMQGSRARSVVEHLLPTADVNLASKEGITPLMYCAKDEDDDLIDIMETLVSRKALLDTQSKDGNTALHFACMVGGFECVKFLVEKQAKTDIKNEEGKTPKDIARENDHMRILAVLNGEDPNKYPQERRMLRMEEQEYASRSKSYGRSRDQEEEMFDIVHHWKETYFNIPYH
eukprot:Rmarinus@m.16242